MSYAQYINHMKNHKKDKYHQQCSGYFGKSLKEIEAEESTKEIKYFIIDQNNKVIKETVSYDEIVCCGKDIDNKKNYWIANSNMLMGRLDLVCSS